MHKLVKICFITVPPPELLVPPENITAAVYTNITFSCTGRGFGEVEVVWTRPLSKVTVTAVHTTVRNDEQIISTLMIPYVVDIYSGQYCCVFKNRAGSSLKRCANLFVQGEYHLVLVHIQNFRNCIYKLNLCLS